MKKLNLLNQQWQGSGDKNDIYYGAQKVAQVFKDKLDFKSIPVEVDSDYIIENDIYAYKVICSQLDATITLIDKFKPDSIFTVGGDCGVELAPVSYLNNLYDNIGIIWYDAHGDLNIPEESESKQFHGMPLRTLLGKGDSEIIRKLFSTINSNQVFLLGGRDYDQAELDYINKNKITHFSVESISDNPQQVVKYIQKLGFGKLYIHIDLDVLEPNEFPNVKVPTKDGLSINSLIKSIDLLSSNFNIVGSSIVEYIHKSQDSLDYVEQIAKSLKVIK